MRRILLLAKRDYLQTVASRGYLVGLILFPLLFGGAFLFLPLANRGQARNLDIAVLDHTGASAAAVIQAAEEANQRATAGGPFGAQRMPRYTFEEVKPEPDHSAQLLSLSDQIRKGELFVVLDIPPDALRTSGDGKQEQVRYYTNSGGLVDQMSLWLPAAVNEGLRRVRLTELGVDPARLPGVLSNIPVVSMNLVSQDPATGKIVQGEKKNPIQSAAVPFFLVFLMIMVTLVGSAPNLGGVAEDKMQRVHEMLLSSASSFELMMGKVLAAVGCVADHFHFLHHRRTAGSGGYGDVRTGAAASAPVVLCVSDCGRPDALGPGSRARIGLFHTAGRPASGIPLDSADHDPDVRPGRDHAAAQWRTRAGDVVHPAVHSRGHASAAGSSRRRSLVAAMAGISRRVRLGRRHRLGRRARFPHRDPFARQNAAALRTGAMGVARLILTPSAQIQLQFPCHLR